MHARLQTMLDGLEQAVTSTGGCAVGHVIALAEAVQAVSERPDYRLALEVHCAGQFDGGLFSGLAHRLGWSGLADVARCCTLTGYGVVLVSALERALDGYWTGCVPEGDDPDRLAISAAVGAWWSRHADETGAVGVEVLA